jgi:hypothetical protein
MTADFSSASTLHTNTLLPSQPVRSPPTSPLSSSSPSSCSALASSYHRNLYAPYKPRNGPASCRGRAGIARASTREREKRCSARATHTPFWAWTAASAATGRVSRARAGGDSSISRRRGRSTRSGSGQKVENRLWYGKGATEIHLSARQVLTMIIACTIRLAHRLRLPSACRARLLREYTACKQSQSAWTLNTVILVSDSSTLPTHLLQSRSPVAFIKHFAFV